MKRMFKLKEEQLIDKLKKEYLNYIFEAWEEVTVEDVYEDFDSLNIKDQQTVESWYTKFGKKLLDTLSFGREFSIIDVKPEIQKLDSNAVLKAVLEDVVLNIESATVDEIIEDFEDLDGATKKGLRFWCKGIVDKINHFIEVIK